jgi:NitT/TauT family transport system permease protein
MSDRTATLPTESPPPPSTGEPSPLRFSLGRRYELLPPFVVLLGFVGVWYLISAFVLSEQRRNILLPFPHDVWTVAFGDAANRSDLLTGLKLSFQVAAVGLVIAMIVGVFFAVVMRQANWIETSFYPYAIFLQTVPVLALVPMIGLWLGFGFGARVLVAVIISLFPIITNTLFGLKSADRALDDIFTLHGASRWTRLTKLQLPSAIPAMLTGFQISAGLSVIGTIVGEFFFGRGEVGLGRLIQLYSARLRAEELIASIALSALLGIAFFAFFGWVKTRLTSSWDESAESGQT